jgi:hypothetical protein
VNAHLQYLLYVLRHKWFVFLACRRLHVPLWRAIIHDWTKFLPSEWFPYVRSFYNPDGSKRETRTDDGTLDSSTVAQEFAAAWLHHQKYNPHHWQYWVVINDEDGTVALPMPTVYIREMVADWDGAGRAITGKSDPVGWYRRNGHKMIMHKSTRFVLENILENYYGARGPFTWESRKHEPTTSNL